MSKFLLILKTQFLSVLTSNFNRGKPGKKRLLGGMGGYLFLVIFLLAYATFYEYVFIDMFASAGYVDAIISIVVVASSALTALSAIGTSKVLIFSSRDYDTLSSLPVKPGTIVAAKLTTLYIFELIYTALFMLPCGILYGSFMNASPYFYVAFYVSMLFVPIIPLAVGSLFGALVSWLSAHFKHAKTVGTAIYLLFFVGVIYFASTASSGMDNVSTAALENIVNNIWKMYPVAMLVAKATVWYGGSALYLLLLVGVSLVIFAIVCLVFAAGYNKIHALFAARFTGGKYTLAGGGETPARALLKKEFARFSSSSLLIMNSMAGIIMMLIFAVMIGLKSGDIITAMTEGSENPEMIKLILDALVPFLLGMTASISCTTNSSISLEGRSISILKSLPVAPKMILRAKLSVHMVLCASGVILSALIIAILTDLSIGAKIMTFAIPMAYSYLMGQLGLWLNLKRPNFDWLNETAVIKQGLPVMVTSLGGMLIGMLPMALSVILAMVMPTIIFQLIMLALILAAGILMKVILEKNGDKLFRAL